MPTSLAKSQSHKDYPPSGKVTKYVGEQLQRQISEKITATNFEEAKAQYKNQLMNDKRRSMKTSRKLFNNSNIETGEVDVRNQKQRGSLHQEPENEECLQKQNSGSFE